LSDSWQSAWVEILPDFSNFRNRTNSSIVPILSDAGNNAGSRFGLNFVSVLGGFLGGNILTGIGYTIGRVLSDAISSTINFGLDGIQLASGLGEQVNAVKVQFGDVADEILALSEDAPAQLNLTRAAFDKLAVRFGSFARTIAGDGGDVARVIDDLTTRGADFASVYDIEASEALELFQSGLAGETEPLRRFGLDLSAASVKAYAYANGIGTVGRELTEAEKIQARYGSLMAQTNVVAGDLTNTFGSLANQQRQFDVQLAEAQTTLGEFLLPGFTTFVGYANTTLLPKLGEIIDRVGPKLAAAFADVDTQGLLDELGPMVEDFAVLAAEDGIPAVVDLIKELIELGPKLADSFQGDLEFLKQLLQIANGDFSPITSGRSDGKPDPVVDFFSTSPGDHLARAFGYKTREEIFEEARAQGIEAGESFSTAVGDGVGNFNSASILARGNELGEDFSAGLAFGISKGQSGVITAATKVAQSAVSAVKSFLKISSPSKVMAELGAFAAQGFTEGWDQSRPIMTPGVSIPSPASGFSVSAGAALAGAFDPEERRLLRDLAARVVQIDVDGETVARASISGSARLAAVGAN
jgi:hypothetical protein